MALLIKLIAQYGDGDRKRADHKIKHVGAGHGGVPRRKTHFPCPPKLAATPIRVAIRKEKRAGEGPHPVLTRLVHHLRAALFTFSWDGEGVVSPPRGWRAIGHARMAEAVSEAGDRVIAAEQKIRRRRIADRPA